MANRTDPRARSVHGTNPQNLVEKILRQKIYELTYWKEQCFGLTGTLFRFSFMVGLLADLVAVDGFERLLWIPNHSFAVSNCSRCIPS